MFSWRYFKVVLEPSCVSSTTAQGLVIATSKSGIFWHRRWWWMGLRDNKTFCNTSQTNAGDAYLEMSHGLLVTEFFFFIVLLFICAYKAWVISPPCPYPLPYHPKSSYSLREMGRVAWISFWVQHPLTCIGSALIKNELWKWSCDQKLWRGLYEK
jgi:hypothetical protein